MHEERIERIIDDAESIENEADAIAIHYPERAASISEAARVIKTQAHTALRKAQDHAPSHRD